MLKIGTTQICQSIICSVFSYREWGALGFLTPAQLSPSSFADSIVYFILLPHPMASDQGAYAGFELGVSA